MKKPLSLLFFLVRRRLLWVVGLSVVSLDDLDSSGMLAVTVSPFRLVASTLSEAARDSPSFTGSAVSLLGEDDLDPTKLFLRRRVSERTGEMALGFSERFRLLLRVRPDLRSLEGSRLLLEKGRNLDDRRELLGLS